MELFGVFWLLFYIAVLVFLMVLAVKLYIALTIYIRKNKDYVNQDHRIKRKE